MRIEQTISAHSPNYDPNSINAQRPDWERPSYEGLDWHNSLCRNGHSALRVFETSQTSQKYLSPRTTRTEGQKCSLNQRWP